VGGDYDDYQDCLISDLISKAEYKVLFEYCLSFARFNSIWATYNINAFLPSIGAADPDYKNVNDIGERTGAEFEDPATEVGGIGTGNDGWIAQPTEAGGGKPVTFTKSFKGWDKNNFKRSKKYARIMLLKKESI